MLVVEVKGSSLPLREPDRGEAVWSGGHPNQLSAATIEYPKIDAMHRATKLGGGTRIGVAERPSLDGARAVGMSAQLFDVTDPAGSATRVLDALGLPAGEPGRRRVWSP